jgi:hypothetical protein
MQNKPNFPETKMNISPDITNIYEQKLPLRQPAKQTQFKPNQTQFRTQFQQLSSWLNMLCPKEHQKSQALAAVLEWMAGELLKWVGKKREILEGILDRKSFRGIAAVRFFLDKICFVTKR